MAGTESNPGPRQQRVNMGLVNAWSIVNKAALIHDLIADYNLGLLAVTETFVYEDSPEVHKKDAAPDGYSIIHQHRQRKAGTSTSPRGGGIAIIHRDNIKVKVLRVDQKRFTTCEVLLVKLTNMAKGVVVAVVYRPPKSHVPDFIAEMNELINSGDLGDRFIICGDLNCPGPVNTKGLVNVNLSRMIEEQNLKQHVRSATCRTGNILDHVLTPDDDQLVSDISVHDIGLSDHYLVICKITEQLHRFHAVKNTFRCWKRLDLELFRQCAFFDSVPNSSNHCQLVC
jgi:hypothetical protein